ncbi:amino acid ABC transporter permease [Frigidibacter sp. MR17.14]|uniref:amino acid ABC transporter permease n=1 Tax=Frigidibacter sp. MR17.14 TaxID=3126509 RepID=UPI003012A36A
MADFALVLSFADAFRTTVIIGACAAIFSMLWGTTLFAITLAPQRIFSLVVGAYVQVFRNIPVLVPLYLVYFGFPMIGLVWPAAVCGILALVLQQGAYVSEILRSAAKAIDRSQQDAARSIGLSPWAVFRHVYLPQIAVYALPALGNQSVLLVKDTSLLSAIAVVEVMMKARLVVEGSGTVYLPFVIATALYLVFVLAIDIVFALLGRRVRWK